jgi:Flp pilus assembly pilin Flp
VWGQQGEEAGVRGQLRRGERAATLVEYALVVSVLLVGSLAAIRGMEDSTRAEVANDFDCVSDRPPPPSCQRHPLTTTTTTTTPPPTTPPTPVPDPALNTAEWTAPAYVRSCASPLACTFQVYTWSFSAGFRLLDSNGSPIAARSVTIQLWDSTPPGPERELRQVDCTTDADGACSVSATGTTFLSTPGPQLRAAVTQIAGQPTLTPPPQSAVGVSP